MEDYDREYDNDFYDNDDLMEMGNREAWEDALAEGDWEDDEGSEDPEDFDYDLDFPIDEEDPIFDFDYEPEDE
jgi:hypothetical protein